MQKIIKSCAIVFLCFLLSTESGFSQENDDDNSVFGSMQRFKSISKDQVLVNINWDYWNNTPDNIKINPLSAGFNAAVLVQLLGQHTLLAVASGIGFGTINMRSNAYPVADTIGNTYFVTIPDGYEYSSNKISVSYIDVPLEFRYRTVPDYRGRSWKVNMGFKAGLMIQNHQKYDGDDYRSPGNAGRVKFKQYRIENIAMYRYGPYVRLGFDKVGLSVFYSFAPIFMKDKGPQIIPVTISISVIPI
ncbi:MAG: PorT family protein [Bacteroidetes bacterium]|nr:PorT family protein [Bacteroidota bacterium]